MEPINFSSRHIIYCQCIALNLLVAFCESCALCILFTKKVTNRYCRMIVEGLAGNLKDQGQLFLIMYLIWIFFITCHHLSQALLPRYGDYSWIRFLIIGRTCYLIYIVSFWHFPLLVQKISLEFYCWRDQWQSCL